MRRPTVVMITGTPGSGKTTLGQELSRAMRMPFVARDDIRGGLFATAGAWSDRVEHVPSGDDAVEAFTAVVTTLLRQGISCVVEYVVRHDAPGPLEHFAANADVVVLMTRCRDAAERFARRQRTERLLNRRPVLAALGHGTIEEHNAAAVERNAGVAAEMRPNFDHPVLIVDTDNGYEPDIDAVIDFVATLGRSTEEAT